LAPFADPGQDPRALGEGVCLGLDRFRLRRRLLSLGGFGHRLPARGIGSQEPVAVTERVLRGLRGFFLWAFAVPDD
jgi:hypothetical protein